MCAACPPWDIIVHMNQHEVISLSHLDETGQVRMVDVGTKAVTARVAIAQARVRLGQKAFALLAGHQHGKGEVLNTARVAGVLAAKRCAELIPLCHTLPLSFVGIDFALDDVMGTVEVAATCRSQYTTGVEMEAMTACSVAALTIYDMCKGADKGIVIEEVKLLYKAGGKSGEWRAPGAHATGTHAAATPAVRGAHASADVTMADLGCGTTTDTGLCQPTGKPSDTSVGAPIDAPTGTLHLVYFARVAELIGRRSEVLPVALPLTGAELLRQLVQRYPQLHPAARLQLAVNQEHAQPDVVLRSGDEVAVFEPVTGG